jgi:2-C-methyl-D-erythritol 2,4-cyclodiphosphate synthase
MSTNKNIIRTGIGQDSHRFLSEDVAKPCILGGILFDGVPGFKANSDGDVILHAICNAITSVTHVLILGGIADELCLNQGITDSSVYLKKAIETLGNQKVTHLAITIEGKRPYFKEQILPMRESIASLMEISVDQVGITATSGEGLTDFGLGLGVQAFVVLSTIEYL